MERNNNETFWSFQAKETGIGELFLYGEIARYSWFGDEITPQKFKDDLEALGDINELRVYINSGGGDVFAGWNIINILGRHKARKIGYNDGLAASIAFDILMAMDEVIAMENSLFMTHNCWTIAKGNRNMLLEQAARMEKIDQMRVEAAARKSGKTLEAMTALQDAETWYTAQEAKAEGFADTIQEGMKLAARIEDGFFIAGNERFDLSRYANPPGKAPEEKAREEPARDTPEGETTVPCDGGESQPVEDIEKNALAEQRQRFDRIRNKILGG